MFGTRASVDAEDVLKLVVVLVLVWAVVEIVQLAFGFIGWILGPLRPLIGFVVLAAAVLWLLDRL